MFFFWNCFLLICHQHGCHLHSTDDCLSRNRCGQDVLYFEIHVFMIFFTSLRFVLHFLFHTGCGSTAVDLLSNDCSWDEGDEDEVNMTGPCCCLFCPCICENAVSSLEHLELMHQINLRELCQNMSFTSYNCIQMINYIRKEVGLHLRTGCNMILFYSKVQGLKNFVGWGVSSLLYQPQYATGI